MLRTLLAVAVTIVTINQAHAYDTANLRVDVSGADKASHYYICPASMNACLSINAAKGKTYPIDLRKIERISVVNQINKKFYFQTIPASCAIDIKKDMTLTISGHLVKSSNDRVYIKNLRCKAA